MEQARADAAERERILAKKQEDERRTLRAANRGMAKLQIHPGPLDQEQVLAHSPDLAPRKPEEDDDLVSRMVEREKVRADLVAERGNRYNVSLWSDVTLNDSLPFEGLSIGLDEDWARRTAQKYPVIDPFPDQQRQIHQGYWVDLDHGLDGEIRYMVAPKALLLTLDEPGELFYNVSLPTNKDWEEPVCVARANYLRDLLLSVSCDVSQTRRCHRALNDKQHNLARVEFFLGHSQGTLVWRQLRSEI